MTYWLDDEAAPDGTPLAEDEKEGLLPSLMEDAKRYTWGRVNLADETSTRRQYIDALRAADAHDFGPLGAFDRT